ncbi:hypothetical protein I79_003494 [Cricetulus griseus]|uniref:Uncharacterized protein n=1 Tax=Cricetulus griseus TaxID=10029 RepID=G3H046_CRIGR|nr:hypothetical protein I79_003494 [Cricetulus griseus]
MAQQLRALVALPEDLGSSPSTHMAAYSHLQLQSQGIQHPLPVSMGTRHGCGAQPDMYTGKIPIHMKSK